MRDAIDDLIDWTVQAEGWHHVGSDVRHLKKVRQILSSHQQLVALVERYAGECAECGGRGTFSEHREDPGGHSVLECWECADIRAALVPK